MELCTDLHEWVVGSSYSPGGSTPNTALTTEVAHTGSGVETITVRTNQPVGIAPNFLRLKIAATPLPPAERKTVALSLPR